VRRRRVRLAGAAALALLAACNVRVLEPRPDPSRFFTLTPGAAPSGATGALAGQVLGVGPITFPHYLDRPELVTRIGPNEVRHAASDYWAGSLAEQFLATLKQNLQALLAPSAISLYPWYPASQPDVAVEVDLQRFERASDGGAHLVARWRLRRGGRIVHAAESNAERPSGEDPGAAAAALSELLDAFSREIADAVREASSSSGGGAGRPKER
jgi:uncharacterized protein